MGLRFDPMGGGQFSQAIKTIIEAESQPIKQLEARKAREDSKLKLFQEFKGKFTGIDKALQEIASFKKFREFKVDLGDGQNLAAVTVDKEKAQPGTYQISVDELAARTSAMSNGFEDPNDPVLGMGFIVVSLGNGDSAEIFIDENQSSLNGVANAINNTSDLPVRAAVVKDSSDGESHYKLIMTAKKDGQANHIDFPEFYFLDGRADFYMDESREAKNALLTVDGFPIEIESNDINDFLPGINLHLKQARPDQPFTLTISEDTQKVSGKVKEVVDKVNEILTFITKQNQVDAQSDTRTSFAGDTSLQSIEYRIRNLMHEAFPVPDDRAEEGYRLIHANEMGIEFDKTGQLTFKQEKFQKLLEKDFDGMAEAITGQLGLAFQLKDVVTGYTRPNDGLLALREQGLRHRIKEMDRQIDDKTKLLEKRQASLTEQFSKLQGSLAKMQQQQAQLSALGGGGGGGSMISQLLG